MSTTVYILTGSNIGNREKYLNNAVEKLEAVPGLEIVATSAIYVSDPVDMVGENPTFLNQVIMAEYDYIPLELLDQLEKIERELDRTDKTKKMPRTIDLDILLFGEEIIKNERLIVPHKELTKRAFALIPLVQVTPELKEPQTDKLYSEYIKKNDYNKVILYKDHVARNI